jgi:hypothetical protein
MSVPLRSQGPLFLWTCLTLLLGGCGAPRTDEPSDGGQTVITDGGVAIQCPSGYTLSPGFQITWANAVSTIGCWRASLASAPLLQVNGLPDFELGPDQLSLKFNATDSSGNACTYSSGASIPLTSSCVVVEGSNVSQWFTFSNIAAGGVAPTGSLNIQQWPSAAGQPLIVAFSSDAALVVHAQNGAPTADAPVTGSFQTNAM